MWWKTAPVAAARWLPAPQQGPLDAQGTDLATGCPGLSA